jgi:hypothetical protein
VATVSAQRLAELVPCPVERVVRLADLGILEAHGEGRYAFADVHVVRLMEAFEAAGVSLDDVARGVAAGELSFPLALFLPEPEEIATTYERVAARIGRSPALLRRLHGEVGLPAPADDRIRAEDAEMLASIVTVLDLADDDELSRFARLYGGTMQRLVTSGLQLFDEAVRQRVARLDLPNADKDRAIYEHGAAFAALVSAVVPWLQRRHREMPSSSTWWGCSRSSWRIAGSLPDSSASRRRSRSSTSPATPRSPTSAGTRRPPSSPPASRTSCRRRPARASAGRSSGSATA